MVTVGKKHICNPGYVFDGDTLNLTYQGVQFTTRLQWIDCPETKKTHQSTDARILRHWMWAEQAKTALMNMVQGKSIIAFPQEKDQYDRWICDCYVESIKAANNIEILLCKAGLAVTFIPYNRYDFTVREVKLLRGVITATAIANRKKLGIWSEPNFITPAEVKKMQF
jgi:endonuclease YncB( thermonuclease family)